MIICYICATQLYANTPQKPSKTTKVTKQEIKDSRIYYATLKEDESRVYSLSVRADGFIHKLLISQNFTKVSKNQPLFLFYAPEFIDAQSEYLATIDSKHTSLSHKKLELLGIDTKEIATLHQTHKILNEITFYAPFDGVVFAKNFNVGSGVKKGDEVFKIINLDELWVIATINQEDLGFLQKVANAYVKIEGFQDEIPIRLNQIYPQISNGFIQARFILPNPKGEFLPGAFGQVRLESAPHIGLTLPKNAVLYKNGKYFVFVQEDGEFLPKEIQARRILGSKDYEILQGLDEGEIVAKDALFMLDSDAQNNGEFE